MKLVWKANMALFIVFLKTANRHYIYYAHIYFNICYHPAQIMFRDCSYSINKWNGSSFFLKLQTSKMR